MSFAVFSYGAAAVAYVLLTFVLIARRESRRQQGLRVLVAVSGTAIWGFALVLLAGLNDEPALQLAAFPDALRTLLWILCLFATVPGQTSLAGSKGVIGAGAVLCTIAAIAMPFFRWTHDYEPVPLLALSVIGCLMVEQIMRNSTADQKRVLRPFLWTIAAILAYDLFVYTDAALFNVANVDLWSLRGVVAAAAVPFFLLAAKRHPDWQETLFVSRELVFYSATLTAVGVYLVAVATGAFLIDEFGGEWGVFIQLAYLLAALCVLAGVLSSARLKAYLRVFISKHFYRNRYDYRDEWLRLIRTLSDSTSGLPLDQRSIKAICEIVGSGGGQLWLDRDSRSEYEPFAAWQASFPKRKLTQHSPLVRFLKEFQWVVDSRQYWQDPEHYQHAFRDEPDDLPADSFVVPLMHQQDLLGLMCLDCARERRELNYEDHDLLKTAGRQVAAFLAHDLARERLAEARQFDAYTKLSAFVMHDLKNLLAQQALLVNNSKKFRDRPEFVDDMVRTVDAAVQRMRRLLRQLEQGTPVSKEQRVELTNLILRAVSACSTDNKPRCSFTSDSQFWVRANADQLTSVITHVIQNAQEASTADSTVEIAVEGCPNDRVRITVCDRGSGMSEEFIRRRLFKPFETTKGALGMGIGAYQAREVIRGLGGELDVTSEVGKGTVVAMTLCLERPTAADRLPAVPQ